MNYFISFTVCTAIFYIAFYFLFKDKNEHVFNRFYLLTSLLLSIIIPLCHIPVFPEYIEVISNAKPIQEAVETTVLPTYIFSWKDAFLIFYLIGVFVHMILFISRLLNVNKLVKSGKKIPFNGVVKVITSKDIPVSSFMNYLFISEKDEGSVTPMNYIMKLYISIRNIVGIYY